MDANASNLNDGSIGIGSKTYDPKLGYGIVVGKYSSTRGDTKSVTDFDEVEIATPGSKMYEDARQMALRSGKAFSQLNFDDGYYGGGGFADMQGGYVEEDVPDRAIFADEMTPKI